MLLKEKVAIVTGSAQGIGKAIARLFCEHGAKTVLCDVQEQKLSAAAADIESATGGTAVPIAASVTSKQEISQLVETTKEKFGRIDILVNNAGILRHALIVDMEEEDWDRVFEVNVKGTFLFTQAVARVMMEQRSGKIINISSCSGKKPDLKQGAYNSSKSAIIGFTRVAALELGPYGINCNAICPGATDTEMVRSTFLTSPQIEKEWIEKTALKRLGKPEDMAKVALFLACDMSDHVTGQALIVSAGELMGQ